MDWKTSNHMDGSEIRDSIGLQYFAEDGNTSDTGADIDVYKRQRERFAREARHHKRIEETYGVGCLFGRDALDLSLIHI